MNQITPDNVGDLREVCEVSLGDEGAFQAGPVVIGDTMFVTTAHTVVAVGAKDCIVRWRYVYEIQGDEVNPVNRGVAYLDGKIFRGTADGWILAIDAVSGKEVWRVKAADSNVGEFFSSAPLAWDGLVFMGPAGGDWGIQGRVAAFDATTGKEVWHFRTVPQEKGDPGYESWKIPESAKHGGGGTWTSYTLDEKTGELFVPVANPGPDYRPDTRPGADLYTDSFVVLDAKTGRLKWYYQFNPNDGFDYDLAAAPILFTDKTGKRRVAVGSKNGYLYVFDRGTRKLLSKTAVTTIDTPPTAPTAAGVHACPGINGGVEWNGPAYSPQTNMVYVGSVDWCGTYFLAEANYAPGIIFTGTGMDFAAALRDEKQTGWVYGVDARSGKAVWRYHASAPVLSGATVTAGGLVFSGDAAGNFLIFEAKTGNLLRTMDLGGSMGSGIAAYRIGGTQYVATTAGNLPRTSMGVIRDTRTRVIIMTVDLGANYKPAVLSAVPPEDANKLAGVDQGRARYKMTCAICHGLRGTGGINGPSLVDPGKRLGFDRIVAQILNPAAPMPRLYPLPLKREEVDAIAHYVEQLN